MDRRTLAASDRKHSTKATYAILLRTHVLTDPLATMPIGRVKRSDIESFIVRLRAKALSQSAFRQVCTVLRQVFDTAVRDELLRGNPVARMRRPGVTSEEARSLTRAEVGALLEAAAGSVFEPLLRVLVATGLRRGEALALRWSDVDLVKGLLTVRGTLTRTYRGRQPRLQHRARHPDRPAQRAACRRRQQGRARTRRAPHASAHRRLHDARGRRPAAHRLGDPRPERANSGERPRTGAIAA